MSVYTIVAQTEKQILVYTNNLSNLTAHNLEITIILNVKRSFALDNRIFSETKWKFKLFGAATQINFNIVYL